MSGKQEIPSRFGPSNRISELALHKTSKTVWATTPRDRLIWGNQEPIWPLAASPLGAGPSARIQYLARHKRGFSAWEDQRRKEEEEEEEEESFSRKTRRPSSKASQYQHIVRLSTPRTRRCSSQEVRRPHSNCPIMNVHRGVKTAAITQRLLQLSNHKLNHPDFLSNRESAASTVSFAAMTTPISQRLVRLSLPRLKHGDLCHDLGRPAESIWNQVSAAARSATASARVEMLATPKQLSKDYIPPREPGWSHNNFLSSSNNFLSS